MKMFYNNAILKFRKVIMKKKKFFVIILLLFLNFVNFCVVSAKNAIIFVPGLTGSALSDGNEMVCGDLGSSVWQNVKLIYKLYRNIDNFSCDENGVPINPKSGILNSSSEVGKYGAMCMSKKILTNLNKNFSSNDQEIINFDYDWRLSCEENAQKLVAVMKPYVCVKMVAFSTGGLLAARAAAILDGTGELSKIDALIAIGVPFYGCIKPILALETGEFYSNSAIISTLADLFGVSKCVKNITKNYPSMFDLMPSKGFSERIGNYLMTERNISLNYENAQKVLKSRAWAKKSNGSLKKLFDQAESFHKSLYNSDGEHVLKSLKSFKIIAGVGEKTVSSVKIDTKKDGKIKKIGYSDGDGVVLLKNAIPFDDINKNNIFKVKGVHWLLIRNDQVIERINFWLKSSAA